VALPSIEALRAGDPMTDRVVEQIALGVSTRGYERSLEPVDPSIETRGASKSNASRALIDATTEKLAQFVSRPLDDVDLVAMFIDGIEFAGHSVLVALVVTIDGTKTPLGIWAGSTENTDEIACEQVIREQMSQKLDRTALKGGAQRKLDSRGRQPGRRIKAGRRKLPKAR
jgi:transposase-like protein